MKKHWIYDCKTPWFATDEIFWGIRGKEKNE